MLGNFLIFGLKLSFIVLINNGNKWALELFYRGEVKRFEIYLDEVQINFYGYFLTFLPNILITVWCCFEFIQTNKTKYLDIDISIVESMKKSKISIKFFMFVLSFLLPWFLFIGMNFLMLIVATCIIVLWPNVKDSDQFFYKTSKAMITICILLLSV